MTEPPSHPGCLVWDAVESRFAHLAELCGGGHPSALQRQGLADGRKLLVRLRPNHEAFRPGPSIDGMRP